MKPNQGTFRPGGLAEPREIVIIGKRRLERERACKRSLVQMRVDDLCDGIRRGDLPVG